MAGKNWARLINARRNPMSCDLSLSFQNTTGRLRTIRLEPWARHFLLGTDEKLEIIVRAAFENPSFRVVEANNTTLIYTDISDEVRVIQDGFAHDLSPVYEIEALPVRPNHLYDEPMFDPDIDMGS
jgi:hypothetical protein